jgi:F-box/leucine-rich repeat protein 7
MLSMSPQVLCSIAEADVPKAFSASSSVSSALATERCSLVCCHWLAVDAATRLRLALDARSLLLANFALSHLVARFRVVYHSS